MPLRTEPLVSEDAALVKVLTRLETKLDGALSRADDHEARLRAVERRRTVAPRDLWLGLTGAVTAGAALSSIIANLTP